MKCFVRIYLLGIFLTLGQDVLAYEAGTHEKMSEMAAKSSVLKTDSHVLENVGLKFLIDDDRQQFPNSKGRPKNILFLIENGSNFEDAGARPLNHFYNPLTGKGLAIGYASPDWALEDKGDVDGQEFSFKWARQYFYDALTKSTKDERDQNFGKTFETLGHVIHHLQDMAQPQHVRDDLHCDALVPCKIPFALFGLDHPSLYEKWTKDHPETVQSYYGGYGPVYPGNGTLTQARQWWTTGTGVGIADFTNANFVSAGTNFDTKLFSSPTPLLGPPNSVPIQDLFKLENPSYTCVPTTTASQAPVMGPWRYVRVVLVTPPPGGGNSDPRCRLQGNVDFIATTVEDKYLGTTRTNSRASTFSIFDQDLKQYNVTDATGQPRSEYTLNRFTFQAAYPFLIPKAVGYSAGLIDYFFRGKLEIKSINDDGNQFTIEVKNISGVDNPLKSGDFTFYYDDTNGTRAPLTITQNAKLTNSLAHQAVLTLIANKPRLSRVDPAKDKPLMLMFKGIIGQEEGVAATVLELPLSGFVVNPSYPPTDGIASPRHIFQEDGQWKLSKRTDVAAGNVDWKGRYVNGKPTKVLTWWGPQPRYFPTLSGINNQDITHWSDEIFQNGKLVSYTPRTVFGAALLKDAAGKEWIIAVCADPHADIVYRRPNKKSDASWTEYDPVNNPDGWKEIGRYLPPAGMLAPDRPWFFNGTGTEAQTMRRDNRVLQNGVTRLKIKINASDVTLDGDFKEEGNLEGQKTTTKDGGLTTRVVPPPPAPVPSCTSFTYSFDQETSSSDSRQGSYVVAVDYQDQKEVLATLTLTASRNLKETYHEAHTRTVVCDAAGNVTASGGSDTGTGTHKTDDNYYLVLKFSNTNLPLITGAVAQESTFNSGKGYSISGSLSDDQFYRSLYYLDLRHDLVVVQSTHDVTKGNCTGETRNANGTLDDKLEILQAGKTVTVYDDTRSTSGYTRDCYINSLPGNGGHRDPSTSVSKPLPIFLQAISILGSWSVDSHDNLFISQQYYKRFDNKLYILNHLDGAPNDDPAPLIPIAPADAVYFPIGVIR